MADSQTDHGGKDARGPLEFHSRGRWPLPTRPILAIVGARRGTPYGEAVAERLAGDLARHGVIILSALVPGIAAAAHQGAIEADSGPIAVLGTGDDVIYLSALVPLADRILRVGGTLVSPFPDGTRPGAGNFTDRNRVMATLADVMVVVEASVNSGALVTAQAAIALGKPVMAVPGSIFSPFSIGCHQLLHDGACIVLKAHDVLALLDAT
jgi:DNA processing protein